MNFDAWISNIVGIWSHLGWVDLIDIVFVWVIVYRALLFIRGTGAVQMLAGLGMVAGAYIFSIWQQLDTLNWVLEQFFGNLLLVVVILFQGDIRKALAMIGRNPFFSGVGINQEAQVMEELIKASKLLSSTGTGALIVLEREIGLDNFIERGVPMDAEVVAELIDTLFVTNGPMHDGAVIIKGGRIKSAGCFLPLSTNESIPKKLGTRHRAALGITEETDALVIVVSEENKSIALSEDGKLTQNVDLASLRRSLYQSFNVDIEKAKEVRA